MGEVKDLEESEKTTLSGLIDKALAYGRQRERELSTLEADAVRTFIETLRPVILNELCSSLGFEKFVCRPLVRHNGQTYAISLTVKVFPSDDKPTGTGAGRWWSEDLEEK